MIYCISPDIKLDTWSDCMNLGNPTKVKNLINDLIIRGAFTFRSGTASGKRVDAHIIVSKYLFPLLVFGRGPTQSIITQENGSSNVGIGTSVVHCIF